MATCGHGLHGCSPTSERRGCSEERGAETDPAQSHQRVVRIVTKDFPRYFATVTRCRLETATIGPAGAVLSSTVEAHVQAVFPEGALMKSIKVGLQVPPAFIALLHPLVT